MPDAVTSQPKYHLRGYLLTKFRRKRSEMSLPDVVQVALARPHRASTLFSRQQSMLDRINSGPTPQTITVG